MYRPVKSDSSGRDPKEVYPVKAPAPPSGARIIRWRGTVPPQKQMNFYTKVLSKFTTSSELKLQVSIEVNVDREQADAMSNEAKSGLREFVLSDGIELTG